MIQITKFKIICQKCGSEGVGRVISEENEEIIEQKVSIECFNQNCFNEEVLLQEKFKRFG